MIMQRGFTLLEISIVMIIMAALALVTTRSLYLKVDTRMIEHTAAEVWTIGEYAQNYIQQNGEWPDQTNSCVGAISTMETALSLAPGTIPSQSPWETSYVTSCSANVSFSIAVQTDDEWAPALTNMLAVTQMVGGTTDTTITTLPLPGSIAAFDSVLKKVDTGDVNDNTMETDLYMGDNSILGANLVEASGFVDADNVNFVLDPSDHSSVNTLVVNGRLYSESELHATSGIVDEGSGSIRTSYAADFFGRNSDGDKIATSEPGSINGSVNVNDILLRSVGNWLSARLPDMVEKRSFEAYGGDLVPKPVCPHLENSDFPDPEPRIKVHPAEGNYAKDYDDQYWEVVSDNSNMLHADIYCYYPPLNDTLPEFVSTGTDLYDLIDSGDLVINDLTDAYAVYIGEIYSDQGNGIYSLNSPPHHYYKNVSPIWIHHSDNILVPNGSDFDTVSGFVFDGPTGPILTVNNTTDKWISFDISLTLVPNGEDDVGFTLLVNGGSVATTTVYADGSPKYFNHTVTVDPRDYAEVTLISYWYGGEGTETVQITGCDVNTTMHASEP